MTSPHIDHSAQGPDNQTRRFGILLPVASGGAEHCLGQRGRAPAAGREDILLVTATAIGEGDGTDSHHYSPARRRASKDVRAPGPCRPLPLVPARPIGKVGGTAGPSITCDERSMIRSLFLAARERHWNRDRRRRIAAMLERERAMRTAEIGWVEAMAIQLAEIRTLPEPLESQR